MKQEFFQKKLIISFGSLLPALMDHVKRNARFFLHLPKQSHVPSSNYKLFNYNNFNIH